MIKKGFVDKEKGWNWLKEIEGNLRDEKWNGKINKSGRKCLWYGIGVDLGFKSTLFQGLEIGNGLRKRGNELWGGNDWNSILILKYEKGIELKDHVDRDVFDKKVVIINFCKSLVGFRYDEKINWLKDGEVIEIDSRIKHGIMKVNEERWSISFRKVN